VGSDRVSVVSDVLRVLDAAAGPAEVDEAWIAEVMASLRARPGEWAAAIESSGLSDDRAWPLLGCVETIASMLVRVRRGEDLETASLALALVGRSQLDLRDQMVVGSLLRRGAILANLNFARHVSAGCAVAGQLGAACRRWLLEVSPQTPATHQEVGKGSSFTFARVETDIDIAALEAWLGE
jgi:hypothetical protein